MNIFDHDSLKHRNIFHGFFGRRGGKSSGIYKSLNVGYGSDDDKNIIEANRTLIAKKVGFSPLSLHTLYQAHSSKVITLSSPTPFDAPPQADAMVTRLKGRALGILTADCAPVLFADPKAGVIGAAHAGWKGALGGVLENTIIAMENLGAKRDNIRAVIGPSISQISYEVGPKFRRAFLNIDTSYDEFFKLNENKRHQFNLSGFNEKELVKTKIESVINLNLDTYSNKEDFFSYRRATHHGEDDYGRQISLILLT